MSAKKDLNIKVFLYIKIKNASTRNKKGMYKAN